MMTDFQEFRAQFFALVEKASHVAITSHYSPDDDSIGSVLSVYTILTARFPEKDIRIIYTGTPVERYAIFHNFEKIEWVDDVGNHLDGIDLLIMLDASQYARFSHLPEQLQRVPTTIAIDHHASVADSFTLLLHQSEYSSNAELVYRSLIEGSDLPKEIAEHILLGIVGDTGSFSHVKPGQAEVFVLAKTLVQAVGMPIDQFRSRYGGIPKRIIPLLQELVKNTQYGSAEGWPDYQYTYIDRTVYDSGGYNDEDMSAASHIYLSQYLPRVQGYGWGFVLTPRSDGSRMSSRSIPGSVIVRAMHEALGIGSGHDRASGGYFKEHDTSTCLAEVLQWIQANKPVLG